MLLAALACCCMVSCNGNAKVEQANENNAQSTTYKFVKQLVDGEQVKEFQAKNDTDALNEYFKLMEKVIMENIEKHDTTMKAMFVISPSGDTLNTNQELLDAVLKDVPRLMDRPMPMVPDLKNRRK